MSRRLPGLPGAPLESGPPPVPVFPPVPPLLMVTPAPQTACAPPLFFLFKLPVPAATMMPLLPLSPVPLVVHTPLPVFVTVKLPLFGEFTEPELLEPPVVNVRPEAVVHVWLEPRLIVPQLRIKSTVAPLILMPLVRVNVVLPLTA